ncbi:MAG: threonine synthase [Spirochaetales bacterium]|nr:threonine synthase [Spirochaetales bacterium]
MKYYSTRNTHHLVDFQEALFRGLAPDGGLFVPAETPDLSGLFEALPRETSFLDSAAATAKALFQGELNGETVKALCEKAFTFEPVLADLGDNLHLLELFHGPSCAFKDYGASFLAACMEEFLKHRNQRAVILTATSGDTGSAVARAFHRRDRIDVVILYPEGRVSPLQEKQLTTLGDNVTALEVAGSFDDCQRMVKETFLDAPLSETVPLTSANSINLGRLLPQSFYYIWAVTRLGGPAPRICVPSGNFGNLTAAVLAWTWGLKVSGFTAATNRNDVVPEYLLNGAYTPRPSVRTLSNAMDVGDPSNFERLLHIFHGSHAAMAEVIRGEMVSDDETLTVIRRLWEETGRYIDPHTAVGYLAAKWFREQDAGTPVIIASTAHPGKFLEIVEKATGRRPPLPEHLALVLDLPKHSIKIAPEGGALKDFLLHAYS